MSIMSDIAASKGRCKRCGSLLYQNFGGKTILELLRGWDGDVVFVMMVDIRCSNCGKINTIFYIADMLPTITTRRGRFACAPIYKK